MKKIFLIMVFMASVFSLTLVSCCSDNSSDGDSPSIVGTWKVTQHDPNVDVTFTYAANGILIDKFVFFGDASKTYYVKGTYNYDPSTGKLTLNFPYYSYTYSNNKVTFNIGEKLITTTSTVKSLTNNAMTLGDLQDWDESGNVSPMTGEMKLVRVE